MIAATPSLPTLRASVGPAPVPTTGAADDAPSFAAALSELEVAAGPASEGAAYPTIRQDVAAGGAVLPAGMAAGDAGDGTPPLLVKNGEPPVLAWLRRPIASSPLTELAAIPLIYVDPVASPAPAVGAAAADPSPPASGNNEPAILLSPVNDDATDASPAVRSRPRSQLGKTAQTSVPDSTIASQSAAPLRFRVRPDRATAAAGTAAKDAARVPDPIVLPSAMITPPIAEPKVPNAGSAILQSTAGRPVTTVVPERIADAELGSLAAEPTDAAVQPGVTASVPADGPVAAATLFTAAFKQGASAVIPPPTDRPGSSAPNVAPPPAPNLATAPSVAAASMVALAATIPGIRDTAAGAAGDAVPGSLESARIAADPLAGTTAAGPAQAQPIAVPPAGDAAPVGIDLRGEPGLHRMIDRIEQLRDAVLDGVHGNARDTRIRLTPDALGPVDVAVRRDGDVVQVHFTVTEAATRQLLTDAQPRLVELAEARGVRIDRATVGAGTGGEPGQRPPTQPQPQPQPTRSPAPVHAARAAAADSDHRIA